MAGYNFMRGEVTMSYDVNLVESVVPYFVVVSVRVVQSATETPDLFQRFHLHWLEPTVSSPVLTTHSLAKEKFTTRRWLTRAENT